MHVLPQQVATRVLDGRGGVWMNVELLNGMGWIMMHMARVSQAVLFVFLMEERFRFP